MKNAVAASIRNLAAVALAAAILYPATAAADLKSGVAAYQAGDYETALREFTELAEDGNAHAQFNLAILYLTGRGVEKDIDRSIELHESAAEKGLPAAMHGLGVFQYQGIGVKQNYGRALEWFRKSAARGFANSEFNIGVMYFNSQGVDRDDAEVVKWVTLAASRKFAPAEFRLGQMYETGVIFRKDLREARYWYRLAAEHGDRKAAAGIRRVEQDLRGPPLRAKTAPEPPTGALDGGDAPTGGGENAPASDNKDAAAQKKDGFDVSLPAQDKGAEPSPISEPPGDRRPARRTEPSSAATAADARPAVEAAKPEAVAPGETNRAPPPQSGDEREWRVQFASFRTEAEVEKAWQRISARAADALGDVPKIVVRADLGDRGIYHRLQVGPVGNRAEAVALCARIETEIAGQSCLPVRPRVR